LEESGGPMHFHSCMSASMVYLARGRGRSWDPTQARLYAKRPGGCKARDRLRAPQGRGGVGVALGSGLAKPGSRRMVSTVCLTRGTG
jgi:hypothetical protein